MITFEEMIERGARIMRDRRVRAIISRTTMILVAALLVYWGVRCLRMAAEFHADGVNRQPAATYTSRRSDGSVVVGAIALLLLFCGSVFGVLSVLPVRLMEKFVRPPTPGTHDSLRDGSGWHGPWWW